MTLMKDSTDMKMVVKVIYTEEVDCYDVNIVHVRQVTSECSLLKVAALQTGSTQSGSICYYEVPCNHGDVICNVGLLIANESADFSICEIELNLVKNS